MRCAFAFTEHDTPQLRARIERDLDVIARGVHANDPHACALVLAGGFARGEGTARKDTPLNDYDLVAVRTLPGGRRSYAHLSRALSTRVGLEVDIMPLWRARLPHVGRKLFWLDLALTGQVIDGAPGILRRLRPLTARDLPLREAARLLGNRAAGLLRAVPGPDEARDPVEEALQATKAVLAAMDARLLAKGLYAPTMRERLALASDEPHAPHFARAVAWKLEGASAPPDWWQTGRDVLLAAVDALSAHDIADGFEEHAYHALAGGRLRASPSRALRCATWDILRVTDCPGGPRDPESARRSLARLTRVDSPAWPLLKERLFQLRSKTLQ